MRKGVALGQNVTHPISRRTGPAVEEVMRRIAIGCLFALSSLGCRPTMGNILQEKSEGRGTARIYDLDVDSAWDAAVQILRWDGAGTIEQHRDQHYMLTTAEPVRSQGSGAGLSYIGVWVEPDAESKTRVTCVVQEHYGSRGPIDEESFHTRFVQALRYLKEGKPLPLAAPRFPPRALVPCASSLECGTGACIEGYCRH